MNEWPARPYYPLEGEPAARDPGLGRHALRRGAPRHAASTHPPWSGAGDRDQDLAYSPPGGAPGRWNTSMTIPGFRRLGRGPRPAADLPRRRPQRQVPSSRGRYPRRRFPRWLPVAGGGAAVLIAVVAVLTAHPGTSGARLTGRGTAASPAGSGTRGSRPAAGDQQEGRAAGAGQVRPRQQPGEQAAQQHAAGHHRRPAAATCWIPAPTGWTGPPTRATASMSPSACRRPSTTSRASQPVTGRTSSPSRSGTRTWTARRT